MATLKVSLVSSLSNNEYDDKLKNIFTSFLNLLNNEQPEIGFTELDFFKFSYNDEPYILSRNSVASLTPSKYIQCKENLEDKITAILAVKKVHQKFPYFPAFFISNKDSEINSLTSDKIKRIFLVSAGSTSGYFAPIYKLWESGIIRFPNVAGIRERGWEIVMVGNQRDVETEIRLDREAIGATGQFCYQDEPDKCKVKPILRYYNLPQDVIIISKNLLPFQSLIIKWFENLFIKDTVGNYLIEEGRIISESSSKITGVGRIDVEFENALNDLKIMISRVKGFSEKKDNLIIKDSIQFAENVEEQSKRSTISSFSEQEKNREKRHKNEELKTCKIFLASSEELKTDRESFEIFISRENNELIKKGFYLKLIVWENFIDAMGKKGLQNEYNNAIKECDIFVSLFFTKVGKYTAEEFEVAFGHFQETNKPLIFTYFKDAPVSVEKLNKDDIESLLSFREKISNLGHYRTKYRDVEDLQYQFKMQLQKLIFGDVPISY